MPNGQAKDLTAAYLGILITNPEDGSSFTLNNSILDSINSSVPGGLANIAEIRGCTPFQATILAQPLIQQTGSYSWFALLEFISKDKLNSFLNAVQSTINSRPDLRCAFFDDLLPWPVQVICRVATLSVDQFHPHELHDPLAELRECSTSLKQRLDLRAPPLISLRVSLPERESKCYAIVQAHKLTCDEIAFRLLLNELIESINDCAPEPFIYSEHYSSLDYPSSSYLQESETFLRRHLSRFSEPTVPFDLAEARGNFENIEETQERLDSALAQRIRTMSQKQNVTVSAFFHAALALVMSRTTGLDQVVLGTSLNIRKHLAPKQPPYGTLENILPIGFQLQDTSVDAFVRGVNRTLLELPIHGKVSLQFAMKCSGIIGEYPLFTTLLNYPGRPLQLPPPVAGSKSPTRFGGNARDDYALAARLATRSAASFNRQLLPSNFSR